MVRTQIYLDETTHSTLADLSRKQGKTVSELIREAIACTYGKGPLDEELRTLELVAGLWKDREDIGDTGEYVRRLRDDTKRARYLRRIRRRK